VDVTQCLTWFVEDIVMRGLWSLFLAAVCIPVEVDAAWWIRMRSQDQTILIRPDGKQRKRVELMPTGGRLSPDQTQLAFVKRGDVWLVDVDGKRERKLTAIGSVSGSPDWSPDGRRVVFVTGRSGRRRLHLIGVDGQGLRKFDSGRDEAIQPRFSRDGSMAYLVPRGREGKLPIGDLVVANGKTRRTLVKNAYVEDFAWSPDSKTIAYALVEKLVLHELATDKQRTIRFTDISEDLFAHSANRICWRGDGRAVACRITFLGGRIGDGKVFGDDELFVISLDAEPWWIRPGGKLRCFDWVQVPAK